MALVLKDRVRDTTATVGTGTITLDNAAPASYQPFSVLGDGNQTFYCIESDTQWEVGIGTYTLSGHTLSRTTVLASSNAGSLVNFSAGSKRVYVTLPAAKVSGQLTTYEYVATAGQTTFTGADANAATLAYTPGAIIVTLNGLRLIPGDDFTATNGTSLVLLVGADAGDELLIDAFTVFDVANAPPIARTLTAGAGLTGGGDLSTNRTFAIDYTALHPFTGNISINAGAAGTPSFYFAGDSNTGLFSPGADVVGVATGGVERARFDVNGVGLLNTKAFRLAEAAGGYRDVLYMTAGNVIRFGNANNNAQFDGGSLTFALSNNMVLSGTNPKFVFNETDSGGNAFHMQVDGNNFYLGRSNLSSSVILTGGGYFGVNTTPGVRLHTLEDANADAGRFQCTNASFSTVCLRGDTTRSNSSAFYLASFTTGNFGDAEFHLRGDGNGLCDGAWNGGGADYAEYFEWADGNPTNEDRRGFSVVLVGDQIRKALPSDDPSDILGVISGNPSVIGDAAWNMWKGKYLRDDFGTYMREAHTVTEWVEIETTTEIVDGEEVTRAKEIPHSYESDKIPEGVTVPEGATVRTHDDNGNLLTRRILNPDYDPNEEYTPREKRPEWSTVGLMGKLRLRKGQPTGDRWRKMRDVSETVEEWLVR